MLQRTKRFVISLVGNATKFANLQQNFPKCKKKSAADLCQILSMVTIKIVINSTRVMGTQVTISCQYCIMFPHFVVAHTLSCLLFNLPVCFPRLVSNI